MKAYKKTMNSKKITSKQFDDLFEQINSSDYIFYQVSKSTKSIMNLISSIDAGENIDFTVYLCDIYYKKRKPSNVFKSVFLDRKIDIMDIFFPYDIQDIFSEYLRNCEIVNSHFDYYLKEFRKLRLQVFLRDGEICACCGARPKEGISLTVDHIKPVSKFPELSMDINNLQVLCWDCNQKKSNKHFTDYRLKERGL